MKNLDIFIVGETMNLCIPTTEFARDSDWYSWFNNPKVTRYLDQGMFPNTRDEQEQFLISSRSNRVVLIISNKEHQYLGVISLSQINLSRKTCDVALAVNSAAEFRMSSYISLEAMARITEYGFNRLGINRISAGQHSQLHGWQQR